MRTSFGLLAGAIGFGLTSGIPLASQAQDARSWGPAHTSYFYSEATTDQFKKGGQPPTMTFGPAPYPPAQVHPAQQQMYYQQPGQRVRPAARMRPRQQQPAQPPANRPPASPPPGADQPDRGAQPPAEHNTETPGTQPK